jgi:hypothetical protein
MTTWKMPRVRLGTDRCERAQLRTNKIGLDNPKKKIAEKLGLPHIIPLQKKIGGYGETDAAE